MTVLIICVTGYIGTHTLVKLAENNKYFLLIDNFCCSSISALNRFEKIIGIPILFINLDIRG
jgi:UDP-glucose 4-epimerase